MPCLVTTLKTAPAALPYSAEAPRDTISISSITSVSGHGQAAPDTGAVKSTPSMRYRFSSTPDPNADTRLLVPLVGFVADIPGALLVKSKKLKRRSGVFSMYSLEKFVETPDLRVSTTGLSPVTVTVSATAASPSETARSVVPPSSTTIPSSM